MSSEVQANGGGMNESVGPQTIKAFEDRLLEVSSTLPKRLKQCADYVAANKDRIAVSTVAEMAEGAGVQPSAFMRFCQIMGFTGFSEMQKLFRESFVGGWPDYSTRLQHSAGDAEGTPSALLAEFVEAGRMSLENLVKTVDPQALETAVELLSKAKARMIHIIGLRRSFPLRATWPMPSRRWVCLPCCTAGRRLDNHHAIREGDALLAVTFSPYSAETLDLVEDVREQGHSGGCREPIRSSVRCGG